MNSVNHRSVEQLIFDGIVDKPSGADSLGDIQGRYRGLIEVLQRIPPNDYEKVKAFLLECSVLMPSQDSRVSVFKLTRPLAELNGGHAITAGKPILYLAPVLEKRVPASVRGAVAYGLAELFVSYSFENSFERVKAIYHHIVRWGFRDEAEGLVKSKGWRPEYRAALKAAIAAAGK